MATSRFAILGSGNSTSVPWLQCVIDPVTRCSVCADCMANPTSFNIRNNPSALITFAHPDGRERNVLIDVGKTFRDSIIRCLPKLGATHIDAVILTHAHADAFMGMDDLRDVAPNKTIAVYLSRECYDVVARAFHYLIKKPTTKGLFVASIDWIIIEPWVPFEIEGMLVVPLPVEHGPPGPTLGFEFCYVAATAAASAGDCAVGAAAAPSGLDGDPSAVALPLTGVTGGPSPATLQTAVTTSPTAHASPRSRGGREPASRGGEGGEDGCSCCSASLVDNSDVVPTPVALLALSDLAIDAAIPTAPEAPTTPITALPAGVIERDSLPRVATAATSLPLPSATVAATPGSRIVYLSDIAALPADTRAYLLRGPPIDVFVLDALSYKAYPTHFGFQQSLACALDVGAVRTVLIGMSHRVDHYAESPKLEAFSAAHGVSVELGFDGWHAGVDLLRAASVEALAGAVGAAREGAHLLPPPGRPTSALTRGARVRWPQQQQAQAHPWGGRSLPSPGDGVTAAGNDTPESDGSSRGVGGEGAGDGGPGSGSRERGLVAGEGGVYCGGSSSSSSGGGIDGGVSRGRPSTCGLAYSYEDAELLEWADGMSPSASANHNVRINHT